MCALVRDFVFYYCDREREKDYLMAAANAADPKTERNRLRGSGRVGPSRAE